MHLLCLKVSLLMKEVRINQQRGKEEIEENVKLQERGEMYEEKLEAGQYKI